MKELELEGWSLRLGGIGLVLLLLFLERKKLVELRSSHLLLVLAILKFEAGEHRAITTARQGLGHGSVCRTPRVLFVELWGSRSAIFRHNGIRKARPFPG